MKAKSKGGKGIGRKREIGRKSVRYRERRREREIDGAKEQRWLGIWCSSPGQWLCVLGVDFSPLFEVELWD